MLVWEFRSDHAFKALDARPAFVQMLRNHASGVDLFGAALVFSELVANVVRHAPGPIRINAEVADDVTLNVHDEGPGFDPRPELPSDVLAESGRGMFLIARFTKELRVEKIPNDGMKVCVVLA